MEPRLPSTDEDRRCEVLDEDACRRLLGTTGTGRIGFTDGALPAILPVPFAVRDGHVMIPERRGSPVESALRGAVVAFQVDSFDTGTRTGWSVTVVGLTRLVSDPRDVAAWSCVSPAARPRRIAATSPCSRDWCGGGGCRRYRRSPVRVGGRRGAAGSLTAIAGHAPRHRHFRSMAARATLGTRG